MFDRKGYYNTDKIKSYDARFYVVASERGLGKTYNEKKALMRDYIRRGYKFACLFRTGTDLSATIGSWLSPLITPAPRDHAKPFEATKFKWVSTHRGGNGFNLIYDEEVIGYFRALSIANIVKYETFPLDIREVFFDEFAPVVYKKIAGIDNEGEAMEIVIDTMDHDSRHRKVTLGYPPIRTVMFCNPRNRTSPLYEYLQIPALKFGISRPNRDVVCEQIEPTFEDTEGGLSNEARKCRAWLETTSYIRKIPKGAVPRLSIRLEKHYYTVYRDKVHSADIVARKYNHTPGVAWVGTIDHLSEGETCLDDTYKKVPYRKIFQNVVNSGRWYYDKVETKYSYIQDIL